MNTTVTFRVADGMLVENARMEKPTRSSVGKVLGDGQMWYSPQRYYQALEAYRAHLASLRSIPIAPGCVLEGESLVEGEDFKMAEYWVRNCDRSYPTLDDIDKLAVPIQKPPPPARAFSLAEARGKYLMEICNRYDFNKLPALIVGNDAEGEFCITRYSDHGKTNHLIIGNVENEVSSVAIWQGHPGKYSTLHKSETVTDEMLIAHFFQDQV